MNKLKVESLKVNILNALQLKTAKSNNKYKKSEIYIQDPDEMIQNFEDIQNLKESKQNKLKAGSSISINSDNEISAEVDLSPYYTKTQTAKLFIGRDETYTKEEIDERTGVNGIIAGDNISISTEGGRAKIATTIAYKLRDKAMSIGNSILGRGTSVGVNASATGENSVALGADSVATINNQVSVGNDTTKRIISNVADGVEANDAVTVGQLNKKLSSALDQLNRLAGQLYPVGSIYMNVNNVDPSAIFGGSWERMPSGRMLINSGDGFNLNEVGGEKEHRLTEDELASHNHGGGEMAGGHTHTRGTMEITGDLVGALQSDFDYGTHGAFYHERHELVGPAGNKGDARQRVWFKASRNWTGETSQSGEHTHNFLPSGKNQPHNNMPPYIVVNMWKRIS
nr:MAG TPA: baseplate wedge protein [Caudoviricetes sp.]